MNSDFTPSQPDDPEARITALLLGELTPAEAAAVQVAITQDPALAQLYDRLKRTIGLVEQAHAQASVQPRLSESRRQKLLGHFKIIAPKELREPRRRTLRWLIPASAAALLLLLLAGTLLPSLAKAKAKAQNVAALSRQREDLLRRKLVADTPPATNATVLGRSSWAETRPVTDQLEAFGTKSPVRDPAAPTRGLEQQAENRASVERVRELDRLATSDSAAAPSAAAAQKPAIPGTASQIYLPATEPPTDEYQTPGSVERGGEGVSAPAAVEAPPPKIRDIRMMMRYGLVPKGFKAGEEARQTTALGLADGRQGLASVPSQPVPGLGTTESAGIAAPAPAQSELAPLPLKLPVPAFMGTPTAIPVETDRKERLAEANGVMAGGRTQFGAGGYGGFGGGGLAGNLAHPVQAAPPAGRGGQVVAGQTMEPAVAAVPAPAEPPPTAAGLSDFTAPAPGLAIAPANSQAAFEAPAAGAAKAGSNRGRAGGTYAANGGYGFTPAPMQQDKAPVLGDSPTVGRLFRSAGEQVPAPAARGAVPQAGTDLYALQGAAPATSAPAPVEAKVRGYYATPAPTAGGGPAAPPTQAGTDRGGRTWSRALDGESAELNEALAKANEALAGKDLSATQPQTQSEVRLRGLSRPARDTAQKTKVTERFDDAGTALGFATGQPPEQITESLAAGETLNKVADSVHAKLGVVAAGKSAPATPVTAEALKGITVAEEPPVVRRNLPPPEPQPEVACAQNPFSTFSLNVTDVSFKLAAASLEQGQMPDPVTVRSEEFLNAFDYHDPAPAPGVPVAFAWERAQYPFAQNRDVLRFAVQTAARGREAARPLNLVLLLDNSGSMERADRVQIIHEALGVLASQLQPNDTVSVVAFARTARLWVDGLSGKDAGQLVGQVGNLTPDGGTNLEDALNLAYETALRHFLSQGVNRVVLLTDGAANLGDVDPESLRRKVESYRQRGVALDCFGIGWEGYNDDLLEVLSRNGDGRYGFVNTPEEATTEFAAQLTGALQVAAADVKVQVEFNPRRVTAWRQIGYAKHQLTKEQFRDNTVDAAELAAAESGNALYIVEVNSNGDGDLATVRVRYREPATGVYRELEWPVPYAGPAVALDQASPSLRLATVASAFSEWLVSSPFAGEVTPDALLANLRGAPEAFAPDSRPTKLEWMIRQAKSISGK